MPQQIPRNVVSRRRLIGGAGGAGLALIAAPALIRAAAAQSWRGGNPFSLGIASGTPRADGFVLWTRLAPDPLSGNPDAPGGMSGGDVTLRYEIATDEPWPRWCGGARRPRSAPSAIRCISTWLAWSQAGNTGTGSQAVTRRVRSAAPARCRLRARRSTSSATAMCPAPITSTAIFPAIAISPTRIPNSCCSSATTSTRRSRKTARSCDGIPMASKLLRCRPTATAIHNTGSTRFGAPACAGAGDRHLGRSRGAERLCR